MTIFSECEKTTNRLISLALQSFLSAYSFATMILLAPNLENYVPETEILLSAPKPSRVTKNRFVVYYRISGPRYRG